MASAMAGESIFNLIPQHAQQARRKQTIDVVHSSDTEGAAAIHAPPSSLPDDDSYYPSSGPPATSSGRNLQQAARGGAPPGRGGIPRAAVQELDAYEVARRRQMAQMHGGAMAAALTPEETYRQKMLKSKQMKDHAAENRTRLKEQSIINGIMKSQGETPQTRPAARKPEFTGKPKQSAPGGVDYVEENRAKQYANKSAAAAEAKARKVKYTGPPQARPAGQIPRYLVERKIELEVDKAMAEDEERRKHAGPAVMPEEERVSTLAELEKQKAAALKELNLIPPSKHQLHAYKTQIQGLEKKLAEIEKAIILFSRKVVYVQ